MFEGSAEIQAAEGPDIPAVEKALGDMLAAGLSARHAAGIAAELTSLSRNRAYELALQIKQREENLSD